MRVLIVEDERAFRTALEMTAADEGFDVDTAINGADALDRIARCAPDVIVLDLHMPIMSGLEFLDEYARRYVRRAPIIICSTHRRDLNGHAGDVAAFLAKPIDLDDLLATIRHVASADPSEAAIASDALSGALAERPR